MRNFISCSNAVRAKAALRSGLTSGSAAAAVVGGSYVALCHGSWPSLLITGHSERLSHFKYAMNVAGKDNPVNYINIYNTDLNPTKSISRSCQGKWVNKFMKVIELILIKRCLQHKSYTLSVALNNFYLNNRIIAFPCVPSQPRGMWFVGISQAPSRS